MIKKKIIVVIIAVLIIGIGGYVFWNQQQQKEIFNSIAMSFTAVDYIEYGSDIKAEDFVESVSGEVSYPSFDSQKIGKQKLTYIVTKEGMTKKFNIEIEVKDTQSPQITLKEENVVLNYGQSFDVKDYIESVRDPVDGDLQYIKLSDVKDQNNYYTFESQVDTKQAGKYKVTIKAIDKNGNQTEKVFNVTVKEKVAEKADEVANYNSSSSQTSEIESQTNQVKPTYVPDKNNKVIVINPGHQGSGNNAVEAIGPNSSTMKAKVSSGATGITTGIRESQTTLEIGLKLQQELQSRGYKVIMTRTSQNVDISNKQRAQIGNQYNASAVISLHCDGSNDSSVRGAHTIAISQNNPYCAQIYSASSKLAQNVIQSYCQTTGLQNRGVSYRDDLTGLNWSEVPAIYIEMGFVSNSQEDQLLNDSSFQTKCVQGIADGIDKYFK